MEPTGQLSVPAVYLVPDLMMDYLINPENADCPSEIQRILCPTTNAIFSFLFHQMWGELLQLLSYCQLLNLLYIPWGQQLRFQPISVEDNIAIVGLPARPQRLCWCLCCCCCWNFKTQPKYFLLAQPVCVL
jgi:hypothetical protein